MPGHRCLLDTMYVIDLLSSREMEPLAEAISSGRFEAIVSVVSITEILNVLGRKDEALLKGVLDRLLSSEFLLADTTYAIAHRAGILKLRQGIPTADALIAATGIQYGASHLLTDDSHFSAVKGLIKPVNLKQLMAMVRQ